MKERWKPIPRWPAYFISSRGNVFSTKTNKLMVPHVTKGGKGYRVAHVYNKKIAFNINIHRVMLIVFKGPPPSPNYQSSHLDGNRLNDRLENLRWESPKANTKRKRTHGTNPDGVKNPRAVLTEAQVKLIRKITKTRKITQKDLAKKYGVHLRTISHIAQRLTWSSLP